MTYHELSLLQLLVDMPVDVDLYLKYADNKYTLFSSAGHVFTSQKKELILESGNSSLFIKEDDYKKMKRYRANNLVALLKNPTLTSDERALLLHESISDKMQDMFDNGIDKIAVVSSKIYIEAIVNEMMADRVHTEALLHLTAHDFETYSHSVNVSIYALALGKELGLSKSTLINLGTGALLHDIGKVKISPNIINKPGKLTLTEYKEIQKHPDYGQQLLQEFGETNQTVLDIVKHHHEKLDGSGYGIGLAGNNIKLEIQIVTIADIFDALTTNRSYKTAASCFTSFKTMKIVMKDQLNMKLVDQLIKLMGKSL